MFEVNASESINKLSSLLPTAQNICAYTDFERFFYQAALAAIRGHALRTDAVSRHRARLLS